MRSTFALSVKCGTSIVPPLIVSTFGSVDQMKCRTPASFAALTAANACLDSSLPASQALVTRKTPCAPANAAFSVSGRLRSAATTSSPSFGCLAGSRVNARTLNWPRSEEHTSELQSRQYLVCRLLLEKKKKKASPEPTPSQSKKKIIKT